ncbi:hypothetical protein HK098_003906 [Nowakowskiella sp. JEL0407]|nr:hypothetical protein HK098_003906 [Nowakowskiella sp. JEL0407]
MVLWASTINPKIEISESCFTCSPLHPTSGDYIITASIISFGSLLIWITNLPAVDPLIAAASFGGFLLLAHQLWESTILLKIDKKKKEVSIEKSKFGSIQWVRVSPLDELVDVEIIEEESRKTIGYKMELLFSSVAGFYRLPLFDSLVTGKKNKDILHQLESSIMEFVGLQKPPDFKAKLSARLEKSQSATSNRKRLQK